MNPTWFKRVLADVKDGGHDLCLRNVTPSIQDTVDLCHALRGSRVKYLQFEECRIMAQDWIHIFNALPDCPNLTLLRLVNSQLDDGLFAILFDIMPRCQGLRTVVLVNVELTDTAIMDLARSLLISWVTHLDISDNPRITNTGIKPLFHVVPSSNLKWLGLDNLRISDTGVISLLVAKRDYDCSLATVSFHGVSTSDATRFFLSSAFGEGRWTDQDRAVYKSLRTSVSMICMLSPRYFPDLTSALRKVPPELIRYVKTMLEG